jgi:hypothetical protein
LNIACVVTVSVLPLKTVSLVCGCVTALAQLPGGSVFRRLSQEVEAAAAERHGGIKVYQLQVRHHTVPSAAADSTSLPVVDDRQMHLREAFHSRCEPGKAFCASCSVPLVHAELSIEVRLLGAHTQ